MALALLLVAFLLAQPLPLAAQQPAGAGPMVIETNYRIYDANGKPTTIANLIEALGTVEVVCVGEMHNDPVAHYLEFELVRQAHERYGGGSAKPAKRSVAVSFEMFERDVQLILDEYLAGLIIERHFLAGSRPWPNYLTDYRPIIEFAREHRLPVIAANAPGRYVTRVSRLGRDSLLNLSQVTRNWLPPLPYAAASPGYAAKFNQLMGGGMARPQQQPAPPISMPPQAPPMASNPHSAPPAAHGTFHLLDAQNLRDATMGFSIAEHLKQKPEALVVHVNGRFHSEERMGVPEQLLLYRPKTRILVITIVSGEGYPDFDAERVGGLGDFVILTDLALPRTH